MSGARVLVMLVAHPTTDSPQATPGEVEDYLRSLLAIAADTVQVVHPDWQVTIPNDAQVRAVLRPLPGAG